MRRMAEDMKQTNDITVIALGGSLIVPHLSDDGGINVTFLKKFRSFLLKEARKGRRFILVIGGGRTARLYLKAATQVVRVSDRDLHWLGIETTKLNAYFLQIIFGDKAYANIINSDPSSSMMNSLAKTKKSIIIASGWTPGPSTDYIAVRLAQKFNAREVIIAGNTSYVFDKDPGKFKKAVRIRKLSWTEYQKIIPSTRKAGDSAPVDPLAARLARKIKLEAKIINGADFVNFKKAIDGKKFKGTLIS